MEDDDRENEYISPYSDTIVDGVNVEYFKTFYIPADLFDDEDEDYQKKMQNYAIDYMRETSSIFKIPCTWEFVRWDGEGAIIKRYSNPEKP